MWEQIAEVINNNSTSVQMVELVALLFAVFIPGIMKHFEKRMDSKSIYKLRREISALFLLVFLLAFLMNVFVEYNNDRLYEKLQDEKQEILTGDERYFEEMEGEEDIWTTERYKAALQYNLDALKTREKEVLASDYDRIIRHYLEVLESATGSNKMEGTDLEELREQIVDLNFSINEMNGKIDKLNSVIEYNNNSDIISSIITGLCTVLAAVIAARSVTTIVVKYRRRNNVGNRN